MKPIFERLLHPVPLGAVALVLLSALVWWVFPVFSWNGGHPFDGSTARLVLVAALWTLWGLALPPWRRWRGNARLRQALSAGPTAAGDDEAQLLAERFAQALAMLRTQSKPSIWQPDRYLYELPWYLFVGAPGSGTSTALRHAGLQFLPADGGQGPQAAAVRGVGGTRNCDWWFTREAVLIDTAGRCATQDSGAAADAGAWHNFLALLKKSRPRQPINGIVLSVSVADLLQQSPEERAEHAARLRAQLAELSSRLGVRAPLYVLVTKADLIAGFIETFDEFGEDARGQVWGFTFALAPPGAADPLASFENDYQALQTRLGEQLLPEQLQAESDLARRTARFQFLQEFGALRLTLQEFLAQVFAGASAAQASPLVRGVYFSSGTQEGQPIDRVMATLGRSFGLVRPSALDELDAMEHGRSFFLHALLRRLVFAEHHLVTLDARAERRRRALRAGATAAMGLASVALLVGWFVSYGRNAAYVDAVAGRLPAIRQQIDALPAAPAGDAALPAQPLAAVRDAATPDGFAVDQPPLLNTLGLYQGEMLDAGARLAYDRLPAQP